MVTVLQTTWQKAVVVRIRARHVFVLGAVLANLSLVALPRALALDPDRRISQYGHTVWRVQDSAISPLPILLKPWGWPSAVPLWSRMATA